MTRLIFLEGLSGAGKTTLARKLAERLKAAGRSVRVWLEFDHTNPIDFYCTAALPLSRLENLRREYPEQAGKLLRAAIPAGDWRLVRYYHGDEPVFPQPLLGVLAEHELCWHPKHPLPADAYTGIFAAVWRDFAESLKNAGEEDLVFDGALVFHPLNDMLRNYGITQEQAARHVQILLDALGDVPRRVLYLETEDLAAQLVRAHADRGQSAPTEAELAFWRTRLALDRAVLARISEPVFRIAPSDGWEAMEEKALSILSDGG